MMKARKSIMAFIFTTVSPGSTKQLCRTYTSSCARPNPKVLFMDSSRDQDRARARARLPSNVPGPFYVDATCINCEMCRIVAPKTFKEHGNFSTVYQQPSTEEDTITAIHAQLSCPVGSIHSEPVQSMELRRKARESLPYPVAPGIYFNGYADEKSIAASSYLLISNGDEGVKDPIFSTDQHIAGAILVDSPRFSEALAKRLMDLAAQHDKSIQYMFLSHRDDVGNHEAWAKKFGLKRIIHEYETSKRKGTDQCEIILHGAGPWDITESIRVIWQPGHTKGSIVIYDKTKKALFTGDHLAMDPETQQLTAFRDYTWYSWAEQTKSMETLAELDIDWVFPGHGYYTRSKMVDGQQMVKDLIHRMKES